MSSAASRLMPTLRRVVLAGTVADRSDGQLLGAFVSDRDADAFAGLVRRHGPMVLGVCRRVTGDRTVADDAFQAVFIVLARRAGAVKPREQVGNWLYGVAYRTALKARMVLARRRSREKQVEVMPEPPAAEAAHTDWADLQPLIDEELARLPDKLRLPVVLCDLEGRAQRDVAKQLGVPPATLATRLASARRTLAARLSRRGVTLSGGALAGLLSVHGTASAVPHSLIHGMARAAEAVAGGNLLSSLVSAQAVQLSEGVMRMMLLSKLKTMAVVVLTAAALSGGLGLGLVPAYAHSRGDAAAPGAQAVAVNAATATAAIDQFVEERIAQVRLENTGEMDDETFLRRISMDLRGLPPTEVETFFFIADEDQDKRGKVVVWMADEGEGKEALAKRLGIPAERVHVVQLAGGDGQKKTVIIIEAEGKGRPQALAFSPDGKTIALEVVVTDGKTVTTRVVPTTKKGEDAKGTVTRTVTVDGKTGKILKWVGQDGKAGEMAQEFFQLHQSKPGADGKPRVVLLNSGDGKKTAVVEVEGKFLNVEGGKTTIQEDFEVVLDSDDSDIEFLKRVIKDVRGSAPTALEEKYFAEDKDPKKREKLIEMLLKDPAVAKKVGKDWKKKMLAVEKPSTLKLHPGAPKAVPFNQFGQWMKPGELKFFTPGWEGGAQWKFFVPDPKKPGEFKFFSPDGAKGELKLEFPDPKKPGEFKFFTPAGPKGEFKFEVKPDVPIGPKGEFKFEVKPDKQVEKPKPPKPPVAVKPPTRAQSYDKVVSELLTAKKNDAEMLEAVTLVVLGRLPTEIEKRLTLGLVSKAADRKAAWLEVAKALSAGAKPSSGGGVIELKSVIETGKEGILELKLVPRIEKK